MLVPLTPSLYVPGRLAETGEEGRVVVDVGTGFFVEKVGLRFWCLEWWRGARRFLWADLGVGVGTGAGKAVLHG